VVARPGPTLAEMAALLSDHIGVANLLPFVESVTFNAVIGNADSHARNYSILLPPSGTVALAPLYDLISTRLYEGLDAQTPQRINGRTQIDDVRIDDLVAEATGWGLPPQIVERRVSDTVAAMKTNLEGAASKCVERGGIRAWRPPSRIS
jgi:serine/threonine-protein kinase HipA